MDFTLNSNKLLITITKWLILAMILIIPIQIIIFSLVPMPETTLSWLELFHTSPIIGLLHMDILYIINNTFLIFFYIVLYITLKDKENSLLNIALITGIIGAILYYTSNRSIEMLYLSNRYYETADSSLRITFLATASNYLDIWKGTSFNIYYVLSAISLILFSIIILKRNFYTKTTGIMGLISGVLMIVPSSVGMIGLVFSLLSLIPWVMFSLLVMLRLSKY
ncbi:MAG: hypothetical protein CVV57_07310 [Tenericutes bacterium HGW-Tenericutes-2]|jgi:hypothetical protein|nr:MAG: hypothetical protein CVV57_07310 [Tenericutes bacterium HGW-Tenericutes-2]